jgi:hypothetical protein
MRNIFGGDVNNTANARNVYPEAAGASVGIRGSALTPYTSGSYKAASTLNSMAGGVSADMATEDGTGVEAGGVHTRPLTWWFVLVILLVALMYTAQRFGSQGQQFHSVKLSIYNIFVVALAAVIGIGFFKMVFGRFRVPGLSPFIAAV